ncbi:hypothetical protein [Agrococcus sp. DT81.2]|uniref:hypothetical protein n=1 Tax=Agrococcus sp. DT81.2 TaxID=3393414 RepID=UPI003CE5388D
MEADEGWTERDDVEVMFAALDEDHPARAVAAFAALLLADELRSDLLAGFVTPESLDDWADFSGVRDYFMDRALAASMTALRHRDAPDVAYVKLVPEVGPLLTDTPRRDQVAFATLVWRPELGGWRVHDVGGPIPPAQLPRTSSRATPPSYAGDQHITLERPAQ